MAKDEKNVSAPGAVSRAPSMLRIAGVLFVVLFFVGWVEHLHQTASTAWTVGASVLGVAAVAFFAMSVSGAIRQALTSVNLAVILIAFIGIECVLGTLCLQKSDIESASPAEQRTQFKYAEGSFLYHFLGRRPDSQAILDERWEAYYRILGEKFGRDYGERERRSAIASRKRELEEKEIQKFIADHEGLLGALFSVMQVSGLFHAHSAWWFRLTVLLLFVNLVACTIQRYKRRLSQTGFLLTHAGIVVVLLGALIGAREEQKGMIALRLGQADTADSFLDTRHSRPQDLGFAVQLAGFKTIYHRELSVEFLDVLADSLPPNAFVQRVYKVSKGKKLALDGGKLKIRVLDSVPEALLTRKIVGLSQEPKNPAIEIKVRRGDSTPHKWLFALDPESVYADESDEFRMRYVRVASGAELQAELARSKETSLGTLTLRIPMENKQQVVPVRLNEKISFAGYTVEAKEVQANFRIRPEAPALGPAVRLAITKGDEQEPRLVFQDFDFDGMHRPKFADLKISLAIPAWQTPCKLRCLIVQEGDAFSAYEIEGQAVAAPVPIKAGEAASLPKAGASITILQVLPDAGLERSVIPLVQRGSPHENATADVAQPAIQLQIEGPAPPTTQWFLANSAEAGVLELPGYVRIAYADNKDKMPLEWRSRLVFLDEGRQVGEGLARVNQPVSFRGYLFFQSDANKDDPSYTGIQVVRDPSWGTVNAGLLAIIVGVLFTFYVKPYLKKSQEAAE